MELEKRLRVKIKNCIDKIGIKNRSFKEVINKKECNSLRLMLFLIKIKTIDDFRNHPKIVLSSIKQVYQNSYHHFINMVSDKPELYQFITLSDLIILGLKDKVLVLINCYEKGFNNQVEIWSEL